MLIVQRSNAKARVLSVVVFAVPLLFSPVFSPRALADTITLTNGRTLEGHATDNGDTVTVELSEGTVKLAKSQIKSIEQKITPQEEYAQKSAALIKRSADNEIGKTAEIEEWLKLARFANTAALTRSRDEAYRHVLALDPNNADAREALAYVLFNGSWMTQSEKYQAMGMVRFEGKWMTPDAVADIERARARRADAERAAAQQQAAIDLAQAEANRLDAQRQLLEAQQRSQDGQVITGYPGGDGNILYGGGVVLPPVRGGNYPAPVNPITGNPTQGHNPTTLTTPVAPPPTSSKPGMPIPDPPIILPGAGNMPLPGAGNMPIPSNGTASPNPQNPAPQNR